MIGLYKYGLDLGLSLKHLASFNISAKNPHKKRAMVGSAT